VNGEKKRVGVRVDPSTWSIKEWKQVDRIKITADALINPGPGFVFSVDIASDDTGPGMAILYDGHNTGAEPVVQFQALGKDGRHYAYNPPLVCRRGIYLGSLSAVDAVTIQWLPWNP